MTVLDFFKHLFFNKIEKHPLSIKAFLTLKNNNKSSIKMSHRRLLKLLK